MLTSIIKLGAISEKDLGDIGSKIQNIKYEDVKKKNDGTEEKIQFQVCKINFDTKAGVFSLDTNEEATEDTAKKYNHLGGGKGQKPQWHMSRTVYNHIFTRSFNDLLKCNIDETFKQKLEQVKNMFFTTVVKIKNNKTQTLEVIDFKKFYKGFPVSNDEKFDDYLKKNFSAALKVHVPELNEKHIALYVVEIDGQCVAAMEEYKNIIMDSESDQDEEVSKHRCFNCGARQNIVEKMEMDVKYFITDKVNFAQNGDKNNFIKSFTLCKTCFGQMQSGETFMQNNLRTRLVGLPIYVIPDFILGGDSIGSKQLQEAASGLKKTFKLMDSYSRIEHVKEEIDNELLLDEEVGINYFLTNIIFYEASNSATKIKCFIKDVDPGVINKIRDDIAATTDAFRERFSWFGFDLNSFYHVLPKTKSSKGGGYSKKQLMDWVYGIFTGTHIDERAILNQGLKASAKAIHSENEDECVEIILNINKIFYFLSLQQGKNKNKGGNGLDNHFEEFMQMSSYDKEQKGLFLLGALCARVASEERNVSGKKRILNKLNLNGMDASNIIKFTDIVFAKLQQLDILKFNEELFADCMVLLNQSGNTLSNKENLFYILTGYAVATQKIINTAMEKKAAKK